MCDPCKQISRVLEYLGIYEPTLSIEEALDRLDVEEKTNTPYVADRTELWNSFQKNKPLQTPPSIFPLSLSWA